MAKRNRFRCWKMMFVGTEPVFRGMLDLGCASLGQAVIDPAAAGLGMVANVCSSVHAVLVTVASRTKRGEAVGFEVFQRDPHPPRG